MHVNSDKPPWIDALEQSLLLGIVLFSLITWCLMLAMLAH
jgi:hypothetical protein